MYIYTHTHAHELTYTHIVTAHTQCKHTDMAGYLLDTRQASHSVVIVRIMMIMTLLTLMMVMIGMIVMIVVRRLAYLRIKDGRIEVCT